jgi:hypothetical protein
VFGRIDFGAERPRLREAVVDVWIEDTTYADAPAVRVAERRMTDVSYDGDADGIPFTLEWDDERSPAAERGYSVVAFIDVDGDGRPGRGDYVCSQAVPMPRTGTVARLRLQRIG